MTEILHTIEKINGEWFVWKGDPKILRVSESAAGPFSKRYEALTWVTEQTAIQEAAL